MAGISFNDQEMRTLVSKAIFDAMTEEKRTELLMKAIESLTLPEGDSYYGKKMPVLERVFKESATAVASEIIKELLQQPEWKAKIRELIVDSFERATDGPGREKLANQLGDAMAKALGSERY